jgi:hypothetical protein
MSLPLLSAINPEYIGKILDWRGISHSPVGRLKKIQGFPEYNYLLDINSIFSKIPFGDIVDRTQTTTSPFKFEVQRPWHMPENCVSFEQMMKNRVDQYLGLDQLLNLCWSGGHDSTSLVVAFLRHTQDLSRLRILYSPHSVYENREFFELLQKQYPQIEMLDISGDVYLQTHFDGHFVTGHGGDEFTASLDKTFVDNVGIDALYLPWKDYFYQVSQDQSLVEFADKYFALSGRSINTLLEARWCFYSLAKSQVYSVTDNSFLMNQSSYNQHCVSGFFECDDFENYMYYHSDLILDRGRGYPGYKQFLKDYIYEFDQNSNYHANAEKQNSGQFMVYTHKKIRLLDNRWIFKLSDSTVIRTKNLPLLSQLEFDNAYGNSLDYLFNSPS